MDEIMEGKVQDEGQELDSYFGLEIKKYCDRIEVHTHKGIYTYSIEELEAILGEPEECKDILSKRGRYQPRPRNEYSPDDLEVIKCTTITS